MTGTHSSSVLFFFTGERGKACEGRGALRASIVSDWRFQFLVPIHGKACLY